MYKPTPLIPISTTAIFQNECISNTNLITGKCFSYILIYQNKNQQLEIIQPFSTKNTILPVDDFIQNVVVSQVGNNKITLIAVIGQFEEILARKFDKCECHVMEENVLFSDDVADNEKNLKWSTIIPFLKPSIMSKLVRHEYISSLYNNTLLNVNDNHITGHMVEQLNIPISFSKLTKSNIKLLFPTITMVEYHDVKQLENSTCNNISSHPLNEFADIGQETILYNNNHHKANNNELICDLPSCNGKLRQVPTLKHFNTMNDMCIIAIYNELNEMIAYVPLFEIPIDYKTDQNITTLIEKTIKTYQKIATTPNDICTERPVLNIPYFLELFNKEERQKYLSFKQHFTTTIEQYQQQQQQQRAEYLRSIANEDTSHQPREDCMTKKPTIIGCAALSLLCWILAFLLTIQVCMRV